MTAVRAAVAAAGRLSPQASIDEAEREANQLFRKHSVHDLQQHAKRMRDDIDKRRHELRAMVGERYRELIEAADSIVAMRDASESVQRLLLDAKDVCTLDSLRQGAEAASRARRQSSSDADAQLHRVAGQIKLLVDTPEQVWHALESRRFLLACRLYLVARQLYNNLQLRDSSDYATTLRFVAVTQRQWDAISHFRAQILAGVREQLCDSGLPTTSVADALAALVLLERIPPSTALKEMLDARLAALESRLAKVAEAASADAATAALTWAARHVEQTLIHVDVLFFGDEAAGAAPLLPHQLAALTTAPAASAGREAERSFLTGLYPPRTNLHLLSHHLPAAIWCYVPYCPQDAGPADAQADANRALLGAWVDAASSATARQGRLILDGLATSADLAVVRAAVWTAVAAASMDGVDMYAWEERCVRVVGQPFFSWNALLRRPFADAARARVISAFERIPPLVRDAMQQQLAALGDEDVNVGRFAWSIAEAGRAQAAESGGAPGRLADDVARRAAGISPAVRVVVQRVDELFAAASSITADVAAHTQTSPRRAEQQHSAAQLAALQDLKDDLAAVAAVATEASAAAALGIAALLSSMLTELATEVAAAGDTNGAGAIAADRVVGSLFVGRVASGLAAAGGARIGATSESGGSGLAGAFGTGLPASVRDAFRCVQEDAPMCLVRSVTARYGDALHRAIAELASTAEAAAKSGALEGSWLAVAVQDASVQLPAQLSPPLAMLLFGACAELDAALGLALDRATARRVATALLQGASSAFGAVVPPKNTHAAMQLSFDARVLLRLFHATGDAAAEAAAATLRNAVSALEANVDPIDLTIFTAHVHEHVERWVSRSSTLLGALTMAAPAVDGARRSAATVSSLEPHNIIATAPVAKRIPFLPIGDAIFLPPAPPARTSAEDGGAPVPRPARAPISISLSARARAESSAVAPPVAVSPSTTAPTSAAAAAASKAASHFLGSVTSFFSSGAGTGGDIGMVWSSDMHL